MLKYYMSFIMLNKKLVVIVDFFAIIILFTYFFSVFEYLCGFKFLTATKRIAFYYWIGTWYFGVMSCWFDYQNMKYNVIFLKKREKLYRKIALFSCFALFLLLVVFKKYV